MRTAPRGLLIFAKCVSRSVRARPRHKTTQVESRGKNSFGHARAPDQRVRVGPQPLPPLTFLVCQFGEGVLGVDAGQVGIALPLLHHVCRIWALVCVLPWSEPPGPTPG